MLAEAPKIISPQRTRRAQRRLDPGDEAGSEGFVREEVAVADADEVEQAIETQR
jgi:hypothetical protein